MYNSPFSTHDSSILSSDHPECHTDTTHKNTETLPFAFPPVVNQEPRNCNLGNMATSRGTGDHPPSAPAVTVDN